MEFSDAASASLVPTPTARPSSDSAPAAVVVSTETGIQLKA